jgi:N utilization substance protein A
MASPIVQAIQQISEEKNISYEVVVETIEAALAAAYRKDFGNKNQNLKVEYDPETTKIRVFDEKTVVVDQELPNEEELAALEAAQTAGAVAEPELDAEGNPIKRFNPKLEIMVTEAKAIKPDAEIGETLRMELEVPGEFGRMAAQTAKQVLIQKFREAERENVFGEFKGREGEIVSAIVSRNEGRLVMVDLGRGVMATLPPEEQIPSEKYATGQRVKVYVSSVTMMTRGPMIIVSRAHPDIVRKLFATEIPEVASGAVTIHSVAREAGSRSKVAVSSTDPNIDPIGSCIGQRGTRIQTIISELGGEKVDVILFDNDPAVFIAKALAPAKVKSVELDTVNRVSTVRADADQLSLAIGKGGQNVRLASRLTGWKINVMDVNEGVAKEAASAEPSDAKGTNAPDAIAEEVSAEMESLSKGTEVPSAEKGE